LRIYIQPGKYVAGPHVFRNRLVRAISKYSKSVVVSDLSEKFDIEIGFIKFSKKHKCPTLLRLDGCYYDKNRLKLNDGLKKSINKANGVICQSYFSKKMCEAIMNVNLKKADIVYNGIDFDDVSNIKSMSGVPEGSFVSCSVWRPNKRPISIIRGFLEGTTSEHLYMIGDNLKNGIKDSRVHYLGPLTWEQSISVMKSCKYMIHLCHIDSCPNAVIEGLSCGLNVLCTNLGGTSEIVKNDGIILNVDKWNYTPVKSMEFDNLDNKVVAEGINRLKKITTLPQREDLNIKYTVKKYLERAEKIMLCQNHK